MLDRATHRSEKNLSADFAAIPYGRYAPIRRQLLNILRAVNEKRGKAGFEKIPHTALQLRRKPIKIYAETTIEDLAA